MNYARDRSIRHSSAGCVGLEQRIERSVIAHPAADAQAVQIGSSVCGLARLLRLGKDFHWFASLFVDQ